MELKLYQAWEFSPIDSNKLFLKQAIMRRAAVLLLKSLSANLFVLMVILHFLH